MQQRSQQKNNWSICALKIHPIYLSYCITERSEMCPSCPVFLEGSPWCSIHAVQARCQFRQRTHRTEVTLTPLMQISAGTFFNHRYTTMFFIINTYIYLKKYCNKIKLHQYKLLYTIGQETPSENLNFGTYSLKCMEDVTLHYIKSKDKRQYRTETRAAAQLMDLQSLFFWTTDHKVEGLRTFNSSHLLVGAFRSFLQSHLTNLIISVYRKPNSPLSFKPFQMKGNPKSLETVALKYYFPILLLWPPRNT